MGDTPRSAYELAMERLKAADAEAGVVEKPLTDGQKAAIADARRLCASQLAEREILFRDSLRKTADPEERRKLEEELQIDRRRHEEDRDRAIQRIRSGSGS
jgi:hypothetical protein